MTAAPDIATALRTWARGMYPTEAAAELLLRSFGGRFAEPGNPWIRCSGPCVWIDHERMTDDQLGYLSSSERRILALAAALLGERWLDLGDIAAGVDRRHLELILAAIAHAGGSHQHTGFNPVAAGGRYLLLPSLHPWPDPE